MKMAIKKLTTRLKNKTCTYPPIKNHKNNHECRLIRSQTQHKHPEHMYLKSVTPLTQYVQNRENIEQFTLTTNTRCKYKGSKDVLYIQCSGWD
jgi:hypothetical protein